MGQTTIFVSHSHQDNDWCRPFVEALKSVGYDVWYDEQGLQGGAQWVATIQTEVQARDVFIVILTPEAWASQWVQDELQLAIATRRRVLPVLLRNCQVDGFLLTTQWVTVIGEEPPVAARSVIIAIEAPPAPGRTAPVPTETLDDLVTLCKSLFKEGRYTETISACGRALALDPNNVEVLIVKAKTLRQVSEDLKATTVYGQILTLQPNNSEALEDYGYAMQQLRDGHDLLQAYRNIESLFPDSGFFSTLVSGLARLGQGELIMDPALRITDRYNRLMAAQLLKRHPGLVIKLCESYFAFPPNGATVWDKDLLQLWEAALLELHRSEDAERVRKYRTSLQA
jgi:tetratricopeptide (TPR) repeat protein